MDAPQRRQWPLQALVLPGAGRQGLEKQLPCEDMKHASCWSHEFQCLCVAVHQVMAVLTLQSCVDVFHINDCTTPVVPTSWWPGHYQSS